MGITHACFGLSYLTALCLELAHQWRPTRTARIGATLAGIAGLVAHTIFLVIHTPNPASAFGSLVLLAWVFAVFYLYGSLHQKTQVWAVFVIPLVIGLVGLSFAFRGDGEDIDAWFSGKHFWGVVHGILLLASSIGITVGFLASLMYLLQSRRLRLKQSPIGGMRLLSLERLETMNRRGINFAFPLLSVGLLLGAIRAPMSGEALGWTQVKILGTIVLWGVALLLMYLRYGAHLAPRRLAIWTLAAFGLMMITLVWSHPFAGGDGSR